MKILFVSTVPVFPPTDGVRIPPANYLKGLARLHEIDFLLLDQRHENESYEADCDATRQEVHNYWRLPITRGSKLIGIVREAMTRGPYYGYWKLERSLPTELTNNTYDAVIACTPAAAAIFASVSLQSLLSGRPLWVAAISDVHSLVIARLASNASKNHRIVARTVQKLVFALRSRLLARNEMRMLEMFDFHTVQSDKEVDWIRVQGGVELHKKTVQISNAVNDQLFSLPVEREKKSIVFVGALYALYAGRFEWFVHSVWREAQQQDVELSLTAVGRGASESLQETMKRNGVNYVSFVENLNDIYREHDFLIAPIFKGFGLINKVVEAMASGCLVVGDTTAFNGIPDFEAGKHGFVANTEEEFLDVLTNQLGDLDRLNVMRAEARRLMEKHFRWEQRIEQIEKQILTKGKLLTCHE